MRKIASAADRWEFTILRLLRMPQAVTRRDCQDRARVKGDAVSAAARDAVVTVVDRPTRKTVAFDWRDSTECCYREQIWVSAKARVKGFCALSGAPIRPGDSIFHPRKGRSAPLNVGAMVLASVINDEVDQCSMEADSHA
jgi:hypothetical protein